MTYWRALEKRSKILWQALFSQSALIERGVSVYIDTRAVPQGAEGEGQAAATPPAPEETAWMADAAAETLQLPDGQRDTAAAWVLPAAARKKPSKDAEERALPDGMQTGTGRLDETFGNRTPEGGDEFVLASDAGAARLLEELRQIERSGAPLIRQGRHAAAAEENELSSPVVGAEMADWSAWLERDARRYDGGFELM